MKNLKYILLISIFLFISMTDRSETQVREYRVTDCLSLPLSESSLKEVLDYYDIAFPEKVMAQAKLESGNFKSNICLCYNNLFGLYNSSSGDYYRFTTWQESVKFYKIKIQSRLKKGEDYYEFLERIGYAEDNNYIDKIEDVLENYSYKKDGTCKGTP